MEPTSPTNSSARAAIRAASAARTGSRTSSDAVLDPALAADVVAFEVWLAERLRSEHAQLAERLQHEVASQLRLRVFLAANINGKSESGVEDRVQSRSQNNGESSVQVPVLPSGVDERARSRCQSNAGSSVHSNAEKHSGVEGRVQSRCQSDGGESSVPSAGGSRPTRVSAESYVASAETDVFGQSPEFIVPVAPKSTSVTRPSLKCEPWNMSSTSRNSIISSRDSNRPRYSQKRINSLAGLKHHDVHEMTCLERFVNSDRFESISAIVVLCCTATMGAEIQYFGYTSGYNLNISPYSEPGHKVWPQAEAVFQWAEVFYNTVFALELVLRLVVMQKAALFSSWVWFDTIIVVAGWIDFLGLMSVGGLDPVILRVLRLFRILRLLKVLKSSRVIDTLFLLVKSIQASMGALFWSFLLLIMVQLAIGICLSQLLRDFIDDDTQDEGARVEVFDYFGTFSNSMLTMFEITLANWIICCRLLYTRVSEWYGLFFILYRGCFMFAVLRVVTAVFIAETTRCASSDDEIAVAKKNRQREEYCKSLKVLFEELDTSGDGVLTRDEFEPLITDDLLKTWLQTLEVDTHDLHHLFAILDNGDSSIDVNEFTTGLTKVKGPAKSIDVLRALVMLDELDSKLDRILEVRAGDWLPEQAHVTRDGDVTPGTPPVSPLSLPPQRATGRKRTWARDPEDLIAEKLQTPKRKTSVPSMDAPVPGNQETSKNGLYDADLDVTIMPENVRLRL